MKPLNASRQVEKSMKRFVFFLFTLAVAAGCAKENSEPQKPVQEKTLEQRVFEKARGLFEGSPLEFKNVTREGLALAEDKVKIFEEIPSGSFKDKQMLVGPTKTATVSNVGVFYIVYNVDARRIIVEFQLLSGDTKLTYQ